MERPATIISQPMRKQPRLVIFDDDSVLLARFTQQYRERGYEVIPVLVADGGNDNLMQDGRIVQGSSAPLTDADKEHHADPTRTVANELALAKAKASANPNRDRFAVDLAIYEAMQGFEYGVKSKDEARALLAELKPDAVLSDMQMRRPVDPDASEEQQVEDPDVLMGQHIMAIAAQLAPSAPRAIHTGKYFMEGKQFDFLMNHLDLKEDRDAYLADLAASNEHGYLLRGKDAKGQSDTCDAIDLYFRKSFIEGRTPQIIMGGGRSPSSQSPCR